MFRSIIIEATSCYTRTLEGEEATIETLKPFKNQIHTITADNGKEFSFHEEIESKLKVFHTILGKEEL